MNVILTRSKEELKAIQYAKGSGDETLLAACEYFTVNRYDIKGTPIVLCAEASSFHSVLCLGGEGYILHEAVRYPIKKGDSFFVPADTGKYEIFGSATVIVSRI